MENKLKLKIIDESDEDCNLYVVEENGKGVFSSRSFIEASRYIAKREAEAEEKF
jgi:hypothetical protein